MIFDADQIRLLLIMADWINILVKGVILHGGRGTRLRPITYSEVKQLVPVGGKPISQYALEDMIAVGIDEIAIVIGNIGGQEVKEYYGDGSKWGAKLTYIFQPKPLGIAHAVGMAEDFVAGDDFLVYLGDNILHGGIAQLKEAFENDRDDALVALTRVPDPQKYGVAVVAEGTIKRLVEKPTETLSNLALVGVYFLKADAFKVIRSLKPSARGEYEITEVLQELIDLGKKVGMKEIEGWWKDTGTMEDIIEANRLALDDCKREILSEITSSANISGRVRIMTNVRIEGNTKIRGPTYIGEGTRIVNAYIGPFTSIGNNCTIDGVEIEDSIVMDGCSIRGQGAVRIHESLLGAECKVTRGNGARRGTKLLVGRNSELEL